MTLPTICFAAGPHTRVGDAIAKAIAILDQWLSNGLYVGTEEPVREAVQGWARVAIIEPIACAILEAQGLEIEDLIADLEGVQAEAAQWKIVADWAKQEAPQSVRRAARDRQPLDGADAQALEGALRQVERELEAEREKCMISTPSISRCAECSGRVTPSPVLAIPTCEGCGERYIHHDTAERIDAAIVELDHFIKPRPDPLADLTAEELLFIAQLLAVQTRLRYRQIAERFELAAKERGK